MKRIYILIVFLSYTISLLAIGQKDKFVGGTSAVYLGAEYRKHVFFEEMLANKSIVSLEQFYRVGGENVPVTPTKCKIQYTADSLYVLFSCYEDNMDFPSKLHEKWFSLLGSPVEQDASFPDKVDLFISPSLKTSSYYQFTATLKGEYFGCKFNAPQVLQDADGLIPQRKYEKINDFKVQIIKQKDYWYAFLSIPWETIEGKPNGCFGLTPVRTRWRNSEVSSPVAMDYSDRPVATDLFIETHLGGTPQIRVYDKILCKLPSGNYRWQRPARVVYPSEKTKREILNLQKTLSQKTTEKNLLQRLFLLQSWVDLMSLEGFNFGSTRGSLPLQDMYVYLTRKKVNRLLMEEKYPNVCEIVDDYLAQLDSVSTKWYADGSIGNIKSDSWKSLEEVESVENQKEATLLKCKVDDRVVNLYLSFPQTGGVRLHADRKGFFSPDHAASVSFHEESAGKYISEQANFKIKMTQKPFKLSFYDSSDKLKLEISKIAFKYSQAGKIDAVDCRIKVTPDEVIYGFGEKFDKFNQKGGVLTLWGMDDWLGLTTGLQNQSYKPIPVFHSTKGYTMFLNSSYRLRADIGNSNPGELRLSQHGDILDYYFWVDAPEQALQSYTNLTGKPILPPKWAFEPWMGRTGRGWRAPGDPVKEKKRVIEQFEKLDIPHSAIYAEGVGAERPDMHTYVNARNIKPLSWYYSAIDQKTQQRLMPDVDVKDLPILNVDNPAKLASRDISYVDFTHPNALEMARRWWKLRLDLGIAGSMVDFGDRVPEDVTFYNGKKGDEMHNFYSYDYHRTYAEVFRERRGNDFILFGRSAAPGTQKWVAQISGDVRANLRGLEGSLNGLLNLSACGFSIWGSDLGGFRAWAEPNVYIRWTQFACFSPLMRSHGRVPKEPWEYGDKAVVNYKYYAWVRENLLDYIYHSATQSHLSGIPMVRAMAVAFPEELSVVNIPDQYMFGKDLMVCPVITDKNKRKITFPVGKWTDLWTGKTIQGPFYSEIDVPIEKIPVYIREGAIFPVRLSSNFKFGESLTRNKVNAFIISLTYKIDKEVFKGEHGVEVSMKKEDDSYRIVMEQALDFRYLIVYGSQITDVKIDGKSLPLLEEKDLTSFPLGWFRDNENNRIVVRTPCGVSKEVILNK